VLGVALAVLYGLTRPATSYAELAGATFASLVMVYAWIRLVAWVKYRVQNSEPINANSG